MKRINYFLIAALAVSVAAVSCKKEEPVTPADPPVITLAQLTGLQGESEVNFGDSVLFTAIASATNTTLASYEVSISAGGTTIGSANGTLSFESESVSKKISLTIPKEQAAEDFYPTVVVKFTDNNGQSVTLTLDKGNNVKIRAKRPDTLFLVDNNGNVFDMSFIGEGIFVTTGDIKSIGKSFRFAESVDKGQIDWSKRVWGYIDGKVALDKTSTSQEIPVPDSEGFGLIWLGFNFNKVALEKMINYKAIFDFNTMVSTMGNKVYWNCELHRDCKVTFLNYPKEAKDMVQCDRFDCFVDSTARYTGQTNNWEVYYVPSTSWIALRDFWNVSGTDECVWITGEYASLPMKPYCQISLNWFTEGSELPTSAISCVKGTDGLWHATAYFKTNFGIKIFDKWAWANELQWTSDTPETFYITPMEEDPQTHRYDGNYGVGSLFFVEGLYNFTYDPETQKASLTKY